MKSEHRHELAENDLSKIISRWRDQLEPHANKILIGFLLVAVLVVGGIVAMRSTSASSSVGFTELVLANGAEDFETVAEDFDGTLAGTWARLRAGEEYLREGLRLSLSDRPASNERLEQAQVSFEKVLKGADVPPEVREKALYGLATTLEAMSSQQTGTGPAIEAYQRLIDEFPETRYRRWAEERIATLESPQAQEFYAWFHSQNPKPEDRPLPRDFPDPFSGMTDESTADPLGAELDLLDSMPPPPPSSERNSTAPTPPGDTSGETASEVEGPALPGADEPTVPEGDAGSDESTTPEPESETPAANDVPEATDGTP